MAESAKDKSVRKRRIKMNRVPEQDYIVRHQDTISEKAKQEFKRVPKY